MNSWVKEAGHKLDKNLTRLLPGAGPGLSVCFRQLPGGGRVFLLE